jgi:hypothetical protein
VLRAVNASVMPRVISTDRNAPMQMIASRAVDYILGTEQLAPFEAGFHCPKRVLQWREQQGFDV